MGAVSAVGVVSAAGAVSAVRVVKAVTEMRSDVELQFQCKSIVLYSLQNSSCMLVARIVVNIVIAEARGIVGH